MPPSWAQIHHITITIIFRIPSLRISSENNNFHFYYNIWRWQLSRWQDDDNDSNIITRILTYLKAIHKNPKSYLAESNALSYCRCIGDFIKLNKVRVGFWWIPSHQHSCVNGDRYIQRPTWQVGFMKNHNNKVHLILEYVMSKTKLLFDLSKLKFRSEEISSVLITDKSNLELRNLSQFRFKLEKILQRYPCQNSAKLTIPFSIPNKNYAN